jgi:hypothetical protein
VTTFSATIVADSICEVDKRITTLQLRYPQFTQAELTASGHLNSIHTSLLPVTAAGVIQEAIEAPAVPVFWHKGETGAVPPTGEEAWLAVRDAAVQLASEYAKAGYDERIAIRLLDPYRHVDVLATTTEWASFISLADAADTESHVRLLTGKVREAIATSEPSRVDFDKWHLPFLTADDWEALHRADPSRTVGDIKRLAIESSKSRCGRFSAGQSAREHLASPDQCFNDRYEEPHLHGHLDGWITWKALQEEYEL